MCFPLLYLNGVPQLLEFPKNEWTPENQTKQPNSRTSLLSMP